MLCQTAYFINTIGFPVWSHALEVHGIVWMEFFITQCVWNENLSSCWGEHMTLKYKSATTEIYWHSAPKWVQQTFLCDPCFIGFKEWEALLISTTFEEKNMFTVHKMFLHSMYNNQSLFYIHSDTQWRTSGTHRFTAKIRLF